VGIIPDDQNLEIGGKILMMAVMVSRSV